MINLSYSTRLLPTTHSSITILTGSLKTKQTQNNVRKKVFLLHIPHKTTFEVTAHFKSSVSPQRTEEQTYAEHGPISSSTSTRQGTARGILNTTHHSDGQPPAIQVVHPKWREQQPPQGFFSDSQQAITHKTKGKLQGGTHKRDIRRTEILGAKGRAAWQ